MDDLLGILVGVVFFGGIGLGIYYHYVDNYETPKKEQNYNKDLSLFKYQAFINAINRLYPKATDIFHSEFETRYKENISNGIDNVGYFLYSIIDEVRYSSNSVGQVKIHNYSIVVECIFTRKVNLKFLRKSNEFDQLEIEHCAQLLKSLKDIILQSRGYIDAIEVNKIN